MAKFKKINILIKTLIIIIIFQKTSFSQTENNLVYGNQNPFSIKWYQIKTSQFIVIFPEGSESEAQRTANTLNYVYPFVVKTSAGKIRPLNVVLQTNLTESNGFATLSPRRMEFFMTPSQSSFSGTLGWNELLSVHEFRHITQFSRCDRGFTKLIHILFGNNYQEALLMMTIPLWFYEGDAVATETALTNSGRGRLPQFHVEMRSLLLTGKKYNYEKVFFGSYKNWYPPDAPYSLGYQYVKFIRKNYGLQSMDKLIKKSAGMSWNPYAFSWAMRRATGYSTHYNYKLMLNELEEEWTHQIKNLAFTEAKPITSPQKKNWIYNNFARYINDSLVLVLRYGQEDIYSFVKINTNNGSEKTVYRSYLLNTEAPMSVSKGKIVWAETKHDIRWGNRSYSVIKMLDIESGKKKNISHRSKLFAPALDPSGEKIVAVEFTPNNVCTMVIIDAETGKEMNRYPNPENEFIQTPVWSSDGKYVVFIKLNRTKGKAMYLMDVKNQITEKILDYSHENIAFPVSDGHNIYYGSPVSGIDNIYAVSIKSGEKYQLTSRKFGAYYPFVNAEGNKLLFSDATDEGYMVMEMQLDTAKWILIEKIERRQDTSYMLLVKQEQNKSVVDSIPDEKYTVEKYKGTTLMNNAVLRNALVLPPVVNLRLQTQNPLSTFGTMLSLKLNMNENASSIETKITYAGFYPVFDFGAGTGNRIISIDSTPQKNIPSLFDKSGWYTARWFENSAYAGVRLPFNFSYGRYNTQLLTGANVASVFISGLKYEELNKNNNGLFFPLTYTLDFTRETSWLRDMLPVWGQE